MYTRCPSCRSEISFEPPANKEALPADYKHRIKCPSCGVTIGVKINQSPVAVNPAPTAAPVQQNAQPQIQAVAPAQQASPTQTYIYLNGAQPKELTKKEKKKAKRANKKSGVGRNIMMMLFSLVFVALAVVGYLITKGTIKLPEKFAWAGASALYFNGIAGWELLIKDFATFKTIFNGFNIKLIAATLMPMILFTLSGINFIVAFISACGKKYSRAFNFIFSLLIGAAAATTLFCPFLLGIYEGTDLIGYFVEVIGAGYYLAIAGAAWGVLQFIFSLFFLKSLKRKNKNKR